MNSQTNKAREAFASISTEPLDWPTLVVREFINTPEPGTEANPIVVGDDTTLLGSASNPIVIYFDGDCDHSETEQLGSDADTEIMSAPEFWNNLIHKSFPNLANEGTTVDPLPVCAPTPLPICDDPAELQVLENPSSHVQLDEKALEMTMKNFDMLVDYSGSESPHCVNSAKSKGESEQSIEKDDVSKAEESTAAHSLLDKALTTSDAISQETTNPTDTSLGEDPSRGYYEAGLWKR